MSGLRVCVLYPERLNLYADRGNIIVIERRCRWRGIAVEVDHVAVGDALPSGRHDLYYLGGGQDDDQDQCAADLRTKAPVLQEAVSRGAVVLGVCGGYQLLGHSYQLHDRAIEGIGLLDVTTTAGAERLVGPVEAVAGPPFGGETLLGFENHRGRTTRGSEARPLAHVRTGHGNNGDDGTEGTVQGSVLGTYLHGPVLARNVWLADWIVQQALGGSDPLTPLDDRLEVQARS